MKAGQSADDHTKEALLKRKDQYGRPPYTSQWDTAACFPLLPLLA
jgi:hypothetical protein